MKKLICSLMVAIMACGSLLTVGATEDQVFLDDKSNETIIHQLLTRYGIVFPDNPSFCAMYEGPFEYVDEELNLIAYLYLSLDFCLVELRVFGKIWVFYIPYKTGEPGIILKIDGDKVYNSPGLEEDKIYEGDKIYRVKGDKNRLIFVPGDENICNDDFIKETLSRGEEIYACCIDLRGIEENEYKIYKAKIDYRDDLTSEQKKKARENERGLKRCKKLIELYKKGYIIGAGQVALELLDGTIAVISEEKLWQIAIPRVGDKAVLKIIDSSGESYSVDRFLKCKNREFLWF